MSAGGRGCGLFVGVDGMQGVAVVVTVRARLNVAESGLAVDLGSLSAPVRCASSPRHVSLAVSQYTRVSSRPAL